DAAPVELCQPTANAGDDVGRRARIDLDLEPRALAGPARVLEHDLDRERIEPEHTLHRDGPGRREARKPRAEEGDPFARLAGARRELRDRARPSRGRAAGRTERSVGT